MGRPFVVMGVRLYEDGLTLWNRCLQICLSTIGGL